MSAARILLCLCLAASLCGCGTVVPELREWPENDHFGAVDFVRIIVRSVECELKNTVTDVINTDVNQAKLRANHKHFTQFLNDWGAEVALTLTIVEKSGLNPSAAWLPISPANVIFSLSGDASLTAQATRIQKLNIFYTMKVPLYRYIAGRLICAVNVGAALAERGIKGTGSALALSYLRWGQASGPVPGAVAVSSRRGGGHVAIVSRVDAGQVYVWNPSPRGHGWQEVAYRHRALSYRVPG
jgi:hypothetical protein